MRRKEGSLWLPFSFPGEAILPSGLFGERTLINGNEDHPSPFLQ
ncbi:hypothetical protein [Pseudomonas sp. RIT-PI-AD]|nr:hypothetical protein [Pseudomonas sp. RIT-PI-AD]